MVVENNIRIIKQKIEGKTIKEVKQNEYGIFLIMEDGTQFQINTFSYQMLLG